MSMPDAQNKSPGINKIPLPKNPQREEAGSLKDGRTGHILLVSLCILIVMPLLYIGRAADGNTFTSWKWIFLQTDFLKSFFLLIPAVVGAFALSRLPFYGPYGYAFILVLSAASILPLWSEPEAIIDASRYFLQAKSMHQIGIVRSFTEWGNSIPAWTDMPLVSFLYGQVFSLFGESRIYIQAFNTLLFAATALLTCLIGKTLWNEEIGFHAGMLLMGIPYLLMQVPLMLVDVPSMFFLTLSIFLFLRAMLDGGMLRMIGAIIALCAAFFSKYSIWPMLLIMPLISIVLSRNNRKKVFLRTLWILFLSGALAGILAVNKADVIQEQIALLRTYQWAGLSRWQEGFASTFLFQTHPFITGLALFGTYIAIRKKDISFAIPGWFLVIVIALQITRIRYIIPILPLLALMASYGLSRVTDSRLRNFISLCIVASSLVIAYTAYLPFVKSTSMTNLKQAGEYINSLEGSSVAVYALPQQTSSGSTFSAIPILDYFVDKEIFCPQEWPGHPATGNTEISSLRFTWEMKKPAFYSRRHKADIPIIVLVSERFLDKVPDRFSAREIKRFGLTSDVFKYQTVVTVYKKD